jgi:hypothetical protein
MQSKLIGADYNGRRQAPTNRLGFFSCQALDQSSRRLPGLRGFVNLWGMYFERDAQAPEQ